MHEIYMLALMTNRTRDRRTPQSRVERERTEQAFYDTHGGKRRWAPELKRLAAVPLVFIASATLVGIAHLVVR